MINFFKILSSYFLISFLSLGSPSLYLFADIAPDTLPTGGNVISGNISISTPEVGKMNVEQTSNQGIINWNTFNVGSSASVHFNQPSVKSSILNNVLSGTSIIHGSIFSNGRLILVNPTGILTGPTSAIRAEGAILSTLKITNNNFLNNNFSFSTNSASSITTKGNINGEYVALISPEISNKGKITTNVATALAAGDDVRLSISDSNLLTVAVNPSKLKTSIKNEGNIKTQNGIVTLKTDVAQSVVDEIVKTDDAKAKGLITENGVVKLVTNTGTIEAKDIKIDAGSKGSSEISGKLNSNSNTSNGGTIEVTAKDIDVNAATISADGKTGGGKVLIGGDWQGSGDLLQATYLNIDDATKISADALISGSGGTIVAWSNIKDKNSLTKVSGALSAKGIDSDGGKIETSGASLFYKNIKVDASSKSGSLGLWLLDPTNLTVGSSEASSYVSALASANVEVEADNTITVNNEIDYDGASSPGTLTFTATSTVLNANVGSSNQGIDITFASAVKLGDDITINTRGGDLTLNSTLDSNTSAAKELTVSGSTGTVTFTGNIGSSYRLSGIDVTAATVSVGGNILTSSSSGTSNTGSNLGWTYYRFNGYYGAGGGSSADNLANYSGKTPNRTTTVTQLRDTDSSDNKSYRYEAYFIPDESGEWKMQVGSDDYSHAYVGTAGQTLTALKNITEDGLWNDANNQDYMWAHSPGRHGVAWSSSRNSKGKDHDGTEKTRTFVAGEAYPFLYYWGENTGGAAGYMIIEDPSGNSSNTSNYTNNNLDNTFYRNVTSVSSSGSNLRLNGAVVLTGASTIDANNDAISFTSTVNGNSSGRNLTVDSGTANTTFSGNVGGSTALADISVTGAVIDAAALAASGDITYTNSGSSTISGSISASSFTKAGSGQLTFKPSDASGDLPLSAGSTVLSAASAMNNLSGSANINTDGNNLELKNTSTTTYSGVLSGSGNITKSGTGRINLSGTNTYSGTTTISDGTLGITSAGKIGNGSYSGTLSNSGTFLYASSADQTLSGVISGTGGITASGSGTVTLSGSNTFTGSVTLSGSGSVTASHANALGSAPTIVANSTSSVLTVGSVTLPSLNVTGSDIRLNSGITTTGRQNYAGNVLVAAGTTGSPVEFTTTNKNINFRGTLKGQGNAKARSITINAGTGNVLFGDRVGYAFNGITVDPDNTSDSFYKMVVTGDEITIKGDVMTYEEQTYNGSILIGSTASNGTTRTLLSMDPKVVFNGSVNDTISGKHTLIAKAVEIDRGVNSTPTVDFKSTVGQTVALKNYQGLTGYQTTGANWGVIDNSNPFGTATGTGQSMTSTTSSKNNDDAKKAQRGVQQFKKTFKSKGGRNIFEMTTFRFGGKGNSLSFRKNVDIIYADSPEFGAPVKTSRGNPNKGGFGGGEGLFGRLFGNSSPDIGTGPNAPNDPNFNPGEFREGANKEFNNSGPDRNIKELFKTFEGGEGKFFNPYALENRQIERQKSPNNSQQDIRLEDDDV